MPSRAGSGESDASSAKSRAAEVNGQQWRRRMRKSQEITTEIRTFIAKRAGTEKVYVSSGKNGVVEKVRK